MLPIKRDDWLPQEMKELSKMMNVKLLNINIGLLGHVDSGKTSLAKCLSQINSTACFDKHPQAQERGITIDLGFSSFSSEPSEKIKEHGYGKIQFTLVDCPGHASLIKTIIGGVHIIDHVILVIDVTKGIQTQTAECLVISEITSKPLLVVLNKTDLIGDSKKNETIKKVTKKVETTLSQTSFRDVPILPIVCKEDYIGERGIDNLIKKLIEVISVPRRYPENPLVLAIDHCFSIKGKGTIITGTVLQGKISLNDTIEIPALKETRKVKSIQMFKQDVNSAIQGDRIGICVTHFNPKQLERGIACQSEYMSLVYGVVINFKKVKYFKNIIKSNAKYHVSVGYETLLGKLLLFGCEKGSPFNMENEYFYIKEFDNEAVPPKYALLEFEKPCYLPPNSIIICSKLDTNINSNTCRISFFGNVVYEILDKDFPITFLPKLKIYKIKTKMGYACNILNENEVICYKMFQKPASAQKFLNMKVTFSTGECGYIESTFGQKDKLRIRIPEGLKSSTIESLSSLKKTHKHKLKNGTEKELCFNDDKQIKGSVTVNLKFKQYMFDKIRTITQHLV